MNLPPDFDKTIWRMLEGDLSEAEFKKLENQLSADQLAQDRFLEIVDLEGLFEQKFSQTIGEPSIVSMEEVVKRQHRRTFERSAMAAAAILLLMGIIMGIIWLKPSHPPLTFKLSSDAQYTVTHTKESSTTSNGQSLEYGSRLKLQQGAVELSLKNDVKAIVRAPADLTLIDQDLLWQQEGVVRYIVAPSAVGFQVQTPELLVTDFGTDFGVISSPTEQDQVHLFQGEIEVKNRIGLEKTEVLSGTKSRIAGPTGLLNPISSTPEFFLTSLEEKPEHLYLSFDEISSGELSIKGTIPHIENLSATLLNASKDDKQPQQIPGKFGNAVLLKGYGGAVQTNWPGIGGETMRSVAMWLRLDSKQIAQVQAIVSWGDTHVEGGKFEIITNPNENKGTKGAIRFDCGRGYAIGETNLYDGEWHHVAIILGGEVETSSGMRVQFFVDGKKEEISGYLCNQPDTIVGTNQDTWMNIGRYLHGKKYLKGAIDELYIFSGVLTKSEVKQVMNNTW